MPERYDAFRVPTRSGGPSRQVRAERHATSIPLILMGCVAAGHCVPGLLVSLRVPGAPLLSYGWTALAATAAMMMFAWHFRRRWSSTRRPGFHVIGAVVILATLMGAVLLGPGLGTTVFGLVVLGFARVQRDGYLGGWAAAFAGVGGVHAAAVAASGYDGAVAGLPGLVPVVALGCVAVAVGFQTYGQERAEAVS